MSHGADFEIVEQGGARRLVLSGNYLVSTLGPVDQDLRAIEGPLGEIDLSGIREIDTLGAWMALGLARKTGGTIVGASERAQRLMDSLKEAEQGGEVAA
jgi:phospholipid/cholesterol/gamma-HCH transport system permease protein